MTPGEYDLRSARRRLPLPESLEGERCLDVGTRDGFWAFEMERRGGEVVAIDLDDELRLDWPGGAEGLVAENREELEARAKAFDWAREALGSGVDRRDVSVYDLDPAEHGRFDFAFIGTLLLHLRDPVGALKAIGRVLDGRLLVNDVVSLWLTLTRPRRPAAELLGRQVPFWWTPNVAGLRRMVTAAGLEEVAHGGPYLLRRGPGLVPPALGAGPLSELPRRLVLRRGMPHAWVLAETPAAGRRGSV